MRKIEIQCPNVENAEQEMKQLRISTAIEMCIQWPHLIRMILARNPEEPRNREEQIRFNILKELTKQEPSILHILKYYNRRNQ